MQVQQHHVSLHDRPTARRRATVVARGRAGQLLRRQAGLTMIEMVFFLVVFGVLIALIFPKLADIPSKLTANSDLQDFQSLITSYGAVLDRNPSTAQASAADAIANVAVPTTYKVNTTTLRNAFGGAVTIAPSGTNTTTDFSTTALPRIACQQFATALGKAPLLVSVNGTALKADVSSQITNTALNTACVDTKTNTILVTRARGA
ncbi:type 4 pilus major pilin [Chitinimonas koreensis]|uniref:type 4 pilus major pilin n=1 Tax=Chitinimonas koreensis TaxID=356302 RepID=UPI00041D1A69|nr:type 4 pilus major pilin [Chitinimonas koreensis]QNM95515.1 hypothetical protein H9L41_16815 [Chitinimonas koreensis]